MTLSDPRKLERFVPTRVDSARVERLWNGVDARGARPPWRWRWPAVGLAAAVAAAGVVAVVPLHRAPAPPAAAAHAVEYDRDGAMTLADGSHITLGAGAKVRLERFDEGGVEVTLERGEAHLTVTHVPGRPFVVHAGRFDVVDVGTEFTVAYAPAPGPESVRVEVALGRVEVRDRRGVLPVRLVVGGESWSSVPSPVPAATAPRESATTSATASEAPVPTVAPRASVPSAKALLQKADTARMANRPAEAAAALDTLRKHHRHDARAGLAAFELGRLRLDALGDPRGAVEAFDDAIALSPAAPFREDAEARRVQALDRTHDPRCSEARDNYLSRYPSGVHAAEVGARCAP